ncbi:MAG: DUF2231 domain-containing protein [candidate division Zixibacteria bacterium]
MPNLHPMIVHFPIALIVVVAICDLIGIVSARRSFIQTANIVSVFAGVGAVMAVISGMLAEESIWHPGPAHEILETHEMFGFIFLGVIIITVIFRLAIGDKIYDRFKWIGFILALIASGIVGYGGYLGGEMVYTHGAGVMEAQVKTAQADSLQNELNILKGEEQKEEDKKVPQGQDEHDHAH